MLEVVLIKKHQIDSYNAGSPVTLAVAKNEEAAKRWIQDEVDGKHSSYNQYMKGRTADWWITSGVFSLTTVEVVE